jgi:hypothetical protein
MHEAYEYANVTVLPMLGLVVQCGAGGDAGGPNA